MSEPIIRVENLSKRYLLGSTQERQAGYVSLRESLTETVRNAGKRLLGRETGAGTTDFWALRDVSFEVHQGDVVGIVGRNEAGKSTLLKILSRITTPTAGRIHLRGRVGSLLEVGTGFHPELTGRENIYLNGAILGMSRQEITRQFDAIVAFAEVEKFLDTPVKRYSSGMYVRLAFAVAAHLNPEILIVDEVLAVGDAEFQKKCLGKMGEVARGGRTVLFVSHNLGVVSELCTQGLYLREGTVRSLGPTQEVLHLYHQDTHLRAGTSLEEFPSRRISSERARLLRCICRGVDEQPRSHFSVKETILIDLEVRFACPTENVDIALALLTEDGVRLAASHFSDGQTEMNVGEGVVRYRMRLEPNALRVGTYQAAIAVFRGFSEWLDVVEEVPLFDITPLEGAGRWQQDGRWGHFYFPFVWERSEMVKD